MRPKLTQRMNPKNSFHQFVWKNYRLCFWQVLPVRSARQLHWPLDWHHSCFLAMKKEVNMLIHSKGYNAQIPQERDHPLVNTSSRLAFLARSIYRFAIEASTCQAMLSLCTRTRWQHLVGPSFPSWSCNWKDLFMIIYMSCMFWNSVFMPFNVHPTKSARVLLSSVEFRTLVTSSGPGIQFIESNDFLKPWLFCFSCKSNISMVIKFSILVSTEY